MSSMLIESDDDSQDTKKNQIQVAKMITNMFSKIDSNDLASLKQYFEKNSSFIKEYTSSVEYSYNVQPQIYSNNNNRKQRRSR